jgi:hypothetical protein
VLRQDHGPVTTGALTNSDHFNTWLTSEHILSSSKLYQGFQI